LFQRSAVAESLTGAIGTGLVLVLLINVALLKADLWNDIFPQRLLGFELAKLVGNFELEVRISSMGSRDAMNRRVSSRTVRPPSKYNGWEIGNTSDSDDPVEGWQGYASESVHDKVMPGYLQTDF